MEEIWVYAEQFQGQLLPGVRELLAEARRLAAPKGQKVVALLLGADVGTLVPTLFAAGADKVLLAEDERLRVPGPRVAGDLVARLLAERSPRVFLASGTVTAREMAAVAAAAAGLGLVAHCTGLHWDAEGNLEQLVPAFGGVAVFRSRPGPQMAVLALGVPSPPLPGFDGPHDVETVSVPAELPEPGFRLVDFRPRQKSMRPLAEAEAIVAGGMGVGNKEGWALLEELAEVLGAAIGATRPAVDEGWASHQQMIGQSGQTVRPRLYIAVGIAGDELHLCGVRRPELFVAINVDPRARIFEHAHVGVTEDYRRVVPALIQYLRGAQTT